MGGFACFRRSRCWKDSSGQGINQKVIGSEGYFVYGHFNQDQNDTACFTVIQVIRTLVKQILIDKWQEQCNWENISCGTSDYERLLLQINLEMQRLLDKNCQVRQTEQTERDTSLNALEEQLVESFKSLANYSSVRVSHSHFFR